MLTASPAFSSSSQGSLHPSAEKSQKWEGNPGSRSQFLGILVPDMGEDHRGLPRMPDPGQILAARFPRVLDGLGPLSHQRQGWLEGSTSHSSFCAVCAGDAPRELGRCPCPHVPEPVLGLALAHNILGHPCVTTTEFSTPSH